MTPVEGLPSELLSVPVPLIGFTGLDVQSNQLQKTVWDSFHSNRKNDRASIQFKLLPANYEFPVSKPKRQSYEWYHPKGILKRNWMLKHLHVLPAIVVVFQELEWNDPQWPEKQIQCAAVVQHLKNALQGRNTRICLVLLQKNPPPTIPVAGEEMLATERMASLTKACDVNPKLAFVLNYNEHLLGHIMRLESAFLEIAQNYYSAMMKQVKSHRDQISDYPTLKIRHQFKQGFISEMRNDLSTALKYYNQAYVALDEITVTNANCVEIKTIAGYTNHKICRLMFKLNVPRDSITQFKAHIEKYRSMLGLKELAFEHYAWLSVQYSAFAELFCEAIKGGLKAIQTQHPGIYYEKAAEYIGQRKEAFQDCLSLDGDQPRTPTTPSGPVIPPVAAANVLYSEFYGVRGNRTGEPMSEQQLITCIHEMERGFNHSAAKIAILGHAMAQFKVYKCLRFRKKLAIGMAEEYLKSGDHAKALTLYSLMLSDYRSDKWCSIFTRVLQRTLCSAFLSAAAQDFIQCSIEAMSPKIQIEHQERITILENLWKVFQSVAPVSASQITPELKQTWDRTLSALQQPILIDLDKISDLIDVRVSFGAAEIKFEDAVELTMYVHSLIDVPLKLKTFSLIIADSKTHFKLKARTYRILDGYKEGKWIARTEEFTEFNASTEFMLEPKAYYEMTYKAEPKQFMENEELQVAKLEIKMGTDKCHVILTKANSLLTSHRMFKPSPRDGDLLDHVQVKGHCYIKPTFHLTTTVDQQNQPMLVNEHFKIVVTLRNNFPIKLTNIGLRIHVGNAMQRNKVFLATKLGHPVQKYSSFILLNVSDLDPNTTGHAVYYVMSLVEGNIELSQKVWYETELGGSRDGGSAVGGELHSPILSMVSDISPVHMGHTNKLPVAPSERLKKQISNHNIKIDFLDEMGTSLKKTKTDTIILPCVNELKFTARLYTLSRQALMRAYKNEDFMLRVNIEVMAPFEIEILDRFFVSDHNIKERAYSNQSVKSRMVAVRKGQQIEDIRVLNSDSITTEWLDKEKFEAPPKELLLKLTDRKGTKANPLTVFGNITQQQEPIKKSNSLEDFNKPEKPVDLDGATQEAVQRAFYNKTMDALHVSEKGRGFFKNVPTKIGDTNPPMFPLFGVYCVRWRRPGATEENESKFLINGIEIVEPLLNLYCFVDEQLYVNEPLVYKITLRNPGTKILHLTATLNQSNSFMFSGHKQLNVSVLSDTSIELKFNLFPWKTGWQMLPELQLEFNREYCLPEDEQLQSDLNHLVKRWMPKSVFIHPPTKQLGN